MKIRKMQLTGITDQTEQTYEKEHREISRMAAAEGMVLLKMRLRSSPFLRGSRLPLTGQALPIWLREGPAPAM